MAKLIPLTNDGCRRINIALGQNMYILETYYLPHIRVWVMDIYDMNNNPIITGISLNVGVDNLVAGKSELFRNQTIRCVSVNNTENNTPDSLGKTCFVIYYGEGEKPAPYILDKMLG